MARVRIIPNTTYHPGHVAGLLAQVAPGPMLKEKDGSYLVKMTDSQIEEFQRRGGTAHRIDILPESDPTSAVADTGQAAGPGQWQGTTTGRETSQPDQPVMAVEYMTKCRERGMTDSQIVEELVKAGWKESQAINLVFNLWPRTKPGTGTNPPAA